jgi:stress-induced morphogen
MAEASGITETSLKATIGERLKAVHAEVTDMSGKLSLRAAEESRSSRLSGCNQPGGCGQSFTSLIVSPEFAGKTSLKRHRLVNAALKEEIALIHAWSAKCQTPEEWQREKETTGGNDGPPLDGTVDGRVEGTSE